MYDLELVYGIRKAIGKNFVVDEMLLKEYGLELHYDNQIITVNTRFTAILPCVGRSETHSLNSIVKPDWDDRFHRYAADVGMTDYNIGWHVHLPKTEALTADDVVKQVRKGMNETLIGMIPETASHGSMVEGALLRELSHLVKQKDIRNYGLRGPVHGTDVVSTVSMQDRRLFHYQFFFTMPGETERRSGVFSVDSRFWDNRTKPYSMSGVTTGRIQTAKPNISSKPSSDLDYAKSDLSCKTSSEPQIYLNGKFLKTAVAVPFVISAKEVERISDEFFTAEEDPVGGKIAVREDVTINTVPLPEKKETFSSPCEITDDGLTVNKNGDAFPDFVMGTVHSTPFGDLIDQGDGTWVVEHWGRGGSRLAAPLKFSFEVDKNNAPFIRSVLDYFRFGKDVSPKNALTEYLNTLFSDYRQLLFEGGARNEYQQKLCKIIVNDSVGEGTYKLNNGVIQQRTGCRWFIMSWKQDGLELIKPLEVEVTDNRSVQYGSFHYCAETGDFLGIGDSKSEAVERLIALMFNRYNELLRPRGDDTEQDAADREFLSSKIRMTSIEEVVRNDASNQMAEAIDKQTINTLTANRYIRTETVVKEKDIADLFDLDKAKEDACKETREYLRSAIGDSITKEKIHKAIDDLVLEFNAHWPLRKRDEVLAVQAKAYLEKETINALTPKQFVKPGVHVRYTSIGRRSDDEDLVAQAKAYLEKPLKE